MIEPIDCTKVLNGNFGTAQTGSAPRLRAPPGTMAAMLAPWRWPSTIRARFAAAALEVVSLSGLESLIFCVLPVRTIVQTALTKTRIITMNNELTIQTKVRDMMTYSFIALKQLSKSERFVLAAEIRQSIYRILRLTIVASKRYHKKTTVQDLDVELATLRNMVKVSA
ncbi:four helix bundle protein [Vibrio metschnikovii]